MNARVKYVIVDPGLPLAILIHEGITHAQAVDTRKVKVISAGFCVISDDGVTVERGGSVSLGLSPQPGDAMVIEDTLALMGLRPLTARAMRRQYLRVPV